MFRMDDNSDDKTEDGLQSFFINGENGNTYTHNQKSPFTQNFSTSNVSWNSANPDDMMVDYESNNTGDITVPIPLILQCVELFDQSSSDDFTNKDSTFVTNSDESTHLHNSCHPVETFHEQSSETSLSFIQKSKDDLNCTDYPAALELNQKLDTKEDKVSHSFVIHHSIGKNQPLDTSGSLQLSHMEGDNASISYDIHRPPHSDKCMRDMNCDIDSFESTEGTAQSTQHQTFIVVSDVMMQTDAAVSDTQIPCEYSSGNVPTEHRDLSEQRLVGEKERQVQAPVFDGMDVSNEFALQEFFCLSEKEPNNERQTQSLCGPKEVSQNLRETVSICPIDDECSLLMSTSDKNKNQILNTMHKASVTKDTKTTSNGKALETLTLTKELVQKDSALEMTWDSNHMVMNMGNMVCMSSPILKSERAEFSVSPIKAVEKCNEVDRSSQELKNLPKLKGTLMKMSKPNLGKSTNKNTSTGSKVRKTQIISYPTPNFKNVKAKVLCKPVLQSNGPALSKVVPRTQLSSASSPSSLSSSRQLTVLSKTPRSDLNADTKAEVLINKTHRQQFNKFITNQTVHVTTHFKNVSHKVPRTTSAMKSNQEDVDKASCSNSVCETGSMAAFFQIKGLHPVKMENTGSLEMTYASNINRIIPKKKGDKENVATVEKQELRKDKLNETFEYGPLFLGSASGTAATSGRRISKSDSSSLRKTQGPKAKVGSSVSSLRRNSSSRISNADATLASQRIRRMSSSVEKGRSETPRNSCIQTQTSPDVLSSQKALELAQYKTKCENQSGIILQLKQLLSRGNTKFEALAIVIQHLLSEQEEVLKQHKTLSQELVNLRGELAAASTTCENLEKARNELELVYEGFVQKLNQQHQIELRELENRLKEFCTRECKKLQDIYIKEAENYKTQLQEQFDNLNTTHEISKLEIEASHSEKVELLKTAYETSLSEIKKSHEMEKKSLEDFLNEKQALLEKHISDLKSENDALNEKLKSEEQKRISREKANVKNPQIMYLEQELESLKAVLEIKNQTLHEQDIKLMKMEKVVDNNTALVDKLKRFQQENEELKARMDKHMAISRQLSTEQAVLQESLEKESKVNKRLSMENEELLWKLHNGNLCSPKKSPTSSAIPFQSPRNSGSFPSPSVSPR